MDISLYEAVEPDSMVVQEVGLTRSLPLATEGERLYDRAQALALDDR